MRQRTILFTILTVFVCVFAIAGTTNAKTIYVDADAPGVNDGSSWENAYNYLQDALTDANASGKPIEVRVAQGAYWPDLYTLHPDGTGDRDATFQLLKGVTLKGGYAGLHGPDPNTRDTDSYETRLLSGLDDAENTYSIVSCMSTDATAVLDGFTITGGYSDWRSDGAGIRCLNSRPTIIGCTIAHNQTEAYGGGMYNEDSNPTLVNCTFRNNSGGYDGSGGGGGIANYNSSPTLINCTFTENIGDEQSGGGIYNHRSSPTLLNCTFTDNRGGGMRNFESSPKLFNCKFVKNSLGMDNDDSAPTLINCTFRGNSAYRGWAIRNYGSCPALVNCLLCSNQGGAIYNWSSNLVLINCTVAGNSALEGNAIACYSDQQTSPSTVYASNCIFWNGGGEFWNTDGSEITILYSDLHGGWPGEGNINADPCFHYAGHWLDPGTPNNSADDVWTEGDYHLRPASPCIDAADNSAVPADTGDLDGDGDTDEPTPFDLDGNHRFSGDPAVVDKGNGAPPIVDMGAYEGSQQVFSFLLSTESVIVPEGLTAAFTVALARDPLRSIDVPVAHLTGDLDIRIESGEILSFDSSNYSQPQTVTLAAAEDIDPYNHTAIFLLTAPSHVPAVVKATEADNDGILSTLYVDANAPGINDGKTWSDAFLHLQDALTYAAVVPEVEQILVAQGTYKPDLGTAIAPGDREATFRLINGVILKGGYAGFGKVNPDARDIRQYKSILSGDLAANDLDVDDPLQLRTEPSRKDNCYHVVTSIEAGPNTVLDGFTITGGRANESYSHLRGGGMHNYNSSPIIADCMFIANLASNAGGAMYNGSSSPTVTDCTFKANASVSYNSYGNQFGEGGAVFNAGDCNPTFERCSFIDNAAAHHAGAIYNYANSPTFSNCIFTANLAVYNRGGAIYNRSRSRPSFTNCIFNLNSARLGGAISNDGDSRPTLMNCTFAGNSARHDGGGIYSYYAFAELTNCLFAGNYAGDTGGAIHNDRCSPLLTNCTLAGNMALLLGGGIYNQPQTEPARISAPILTSCILWDNVDSTGISESAQIYNGDPTVNYSCLYGWTGDLGGIGNIGDDPCFVEPGYRDPNGTPDDANDDFWVDGDYHLKSQAGRWDASEGRWMTDDVTSPCIDAGDPMSPIGLEPFPNGGVVNMGAYGGAAEASKSYFGTPPCETVVAGDINGDCAVDFKDFVLMALHWLGSG